jgi:uncharacterized membrane protein
VKRAWVLPSRWGGLLGITFIVLSLMCCLHTLQLAMTSLDTLFEPVSACNAGCRVVATNMQMQAAIWGNCCVVLLVVGVGSLIRFFAGRNRVR